jgi:hypothetical protein
LCKCAVTRTKQRLLPLPSRLKIEGGPQKYLLLSFLGSVQITIFYVWKTPAKIHQNPVYLYKNQNLILWGKMYAAFWTWFYNVLRRRVPLLLPYSLPSLVLIPCDRKMFQRYLYLECYIECTDTYFVHNYRYFVYVIIIYLTFYVK